jgi:hypothetical protein
MLRHACGFKLANDGHDTRAIQAYLGHRSIMSTVRYTALTPIVSKISGGINNEHTARRTNIQIVDEQCMPTSTTTWARHRVAHLHGLPSASGDEMVAAMDAVGVDGEMLVSSIDANPQ